MADSIENPVTAGTLVRMERGTLMGEIFPDERMRRLREVTVEVVAHGISVCRHKLTLDQQLAPVPFRIPLTGFPEVTLPCVLRARIVETDSLLDSRISLSSLDEVWKKMMPFTVQIEKIGHDSVILRTEGEPASRPVFELRDWGVTIAVSRPDPLRRAENNIHLIRLPETLLDGNEHRLTLFHEESGLPLSVQPISLRLEMRQEAGPTLDQVAAEVDLLRRELQECYAQAFNAVAVPLYRHIDTVALHQRSNFEREIAALRSLLGLGAVRAQDDLPTEVMLPFEDPVTGYGVHGVQPTSTGKLFRYVAPISGFLLPGIAAGATTLKIQGIRRSHPEALEGALVLVNGRVVNGKVYCSRTSESWNINAPLPAALPRQDRNLIELRLPNGVAKGADPKQAEHAVGILFVSLAPAAAPPSPDAAVAAPAGTSAETD